MKIFKYTYLKIWTFPLNWHNLYILLQKEGHLTWTHGSSYGLKKMNSFLLYCYPRMKQIATFYSKMQIDQTIFLQDFSVMFHCHMFANMNVIIYISIIFMYLTLTILKIEFK